MPLISVIVPIYKVENYLDRCVQSVLKQTFEDYELILVDDGSPDKCPRMCDEYAKHDSRIRVIHKENGGLSDARNAGLEASEGELVSFIDSDDFIEPEMLTTLYELIRKTGADIAVCGIRDCYENGEHLATEQPEEIVCDGKQALAYTLEGKKAGGSVCNKLIRKNILGDHRFIKGKTYEDAFFTPLLFDKAKKAAITTTPLYNYWHRTGSITACRFSEKSLDVIEAYEYTLQYVREKAPELTDLAEFRLCWAYFTVLDRMLRTDNYKQLKDYRRVVAFLKKNAGFIVKCPYFQKSRRIAGAVLFVSVWGYRMLSSLNDKKNGVFQS